MVSIFNTPAGTHKKNPYCRLAGKLCGFSGVPAGVLAGFENLRFAKKHEKRAKTVRFSPEFVERAMGIGPTQPAWKAGALPLCYARIVLTFFFVQACAKKSVKRKIVKPNKKIRILKIIAQYRVFVKINGKFLKGAENFFPKSFP